MLCSIFRASGQPFILYYVFQSFIINNWIDIFKNVFSKVMFTNLKKNNHSFYSFLVFRTIHRSFPFSLIHSFIQALHAWNGIIWVTTSSQFHLPILPRFSLLESYIWQATGGRPLLWLLHSGIFSPLTWGQLHHSWISGGPSRPGYASRSGDSRGQVS